FPGRQRRRPGDPEAASWLPTGIRRTPCGAENSCARARQPSSRPAPGGAPTPPQRGRRRSQWRRRVRTRRLQSEVRGQRSEVRGQRSEVRGQRSELRGQGAVPGEQKAERPVASVDGAVQAGSVGEG